MNITLIHFLTLHENECSLVNSGTQEKNGRCTSPSSHWKRQCWCSRTAYSTERRRKQKFIPLVRFTLNEPVIWNRSPVLTNQANTRKKICEQIKQKLPYLLCALRSNIWLLLKMPALTKMGEVTMTCLIISFILNRIFVSYWFSRTFLSRDRGRRDHVGFYNRWLLIFSNSNPWNSKPKFSICF